MILISKEHPSTSSTHAQGAPSKSFQKPSLQHQGDCAMQNLKTILDFTYQLNSKLK
jgi:hypothetical protein